MHDETKKRISDEMIEEYKEAFDIFPAIHKYKQRHNETNLQKLCNEIEDFVRSVYASTKNEQERAIYWRLIDNLLKK